MKVRAGVFADGGRLISVTDARYFVLDLCRAAKAETPPLEFLEHVASELVQFGLEANDGRTSRLALRRPE